MNNGLHVLFVCLHSAIAIIIIVCRRCALIHSPFQWDASNNAPHNNNGGMNKIHPVKTQQTNLLHRKPTDEDWVARMHSICYVLTCKSKTECIPIDEHWHSSIKPIWLSRFPFFHRCEMRNWIYLHLPKYRSCWLHDEKIDRRWAPRCWLCTMQQISHWNLPTR